MVPGNLFIHRVPVTKIISIYAISHTMHVTEIYYLSASTYPLSCSHNGCVAKNMPNKRNYPSEYPFCWMLIHHQHNDWSSLIHKNEVLTFIL